MHRLAALAVAAVVVASTVVGLPVLGASTSNSSSATPLNSCGVIDQPGRYVLTQNVTYDVNASKGHANRSCFRVTANDVHIDGQGYAINGVNSSSAISYAAFHTRYGTAVNGSHVSNATVENLTVTSVRHGVRFSNASDVAVRDVTGVSPPPKGGEYIRDDRRMIAVQLGSVRNATVWGVTTRGVTTSVAASNVSNLAVTGLRAFRGVDVTVRVHSSPGARVTHSLVSHTDSSWIGGVSSGIYVHDSPNATVADNTFRSDFNVSKGGAISVSSDGARVLNNSFEHTDGSVWVEGNQTLVRGNQFSPGTSLVVVGRGGASTSGPRYSGTRVVDNTFDGTRVRVSGNGTRIAHNVFRNGGQLSVQHENFANPRNVSVVDNAFDNGTLRVTQGENTTVRGNTFRYTDSSGGDKVAATVTYGHGTPSGTRVVDNTISGAQTGVLVESGSNATVRGNEIRNVSDGVVVGWRPILTGYGSLSGHVRVYDNTVRNASEAGLNVTHLGTALVDVQQNRFVGSRDGVRVENDSKTMARGYLALHRNVIANDTAFGVDNRANYTVNATGNYWGASDGPGSPSDPDAPFRDPVTGAPANGSGTNVSEGPTPGVSNVHFDPSASSVPSGTVAVQRPGLPTPRIVVRNQTSNGTTVRVANATLARNGFLVVAHSPHNSSLIGVSKLYTTGVHRNVTVHLDENLTSSGPVTVAFVPDRDGNGRPDEVAGCYILDVGPNQPWDAANVTVAS